MNTYRYFAKVNKDVSPFIVEDVYQVEADSPICQDLLDKGCLESSYHPEKVSNE